MYLLNFLFCFSYYFTNVSYSIVCTDDVNVDGVVGVVVVGVVDVVMDVYGCVVVITICVDCLR